MDNCFKMNFTTQQVNAMTNLALAHVGDGAYELLVRSYLALRGDKTVKNKKFQVKRELDVIFVKNDGG